MPCISICPEISQRRIERVCKHRRAEVFFHKKSAPEGTFKSQYDASLNLAVPRATGGAAGMRRTPLSCNQIPAAQGIYLHKAQRGDPVCTHDPHSNLNHFRARSTCHNLVSYICQSHFPFGPTYHSMAVEGLLRSALTGIVCIIRHLLAFEKRKYISCYATATGRNC